jgi:hypothetical protein
MRVRTEPLAWAVAIGLGAAFAAIIGPYLPGWGAALAPAAATLVFAVGVVRVPDDSFLAQTLRVTVALTIGFVATSTPVTLARLAESEQMVRDARDMLDALSGADVYATLRARWITMASMVPIGIGALTIRRRRSRTRHVA